MKHWPFYILLHSIYLDLVMNYYCLHGGQWLLGDWLAAWWTATLGRRMVPVQQWLLGSGLFQSGRWQRWGQGAAPLLGVIQHQLQPSLGTLPGHSNRAFVSTSGRMLTDTHSQWRFKCSMRTSSETARPPGISSNYTEQLKGMSY